MCLHFPFWPPIVHAGVYMQEATDAELAQVREFGFNVIIAYEHGPCGLPADGTLHCA